MLKQVTSLAIMVTAVMTLSSSVYSQEKVQPTADAVAKSVAASLTPAEREAAKLLLYSVVLSSSLGEMVEIPRDIQERYNSAAKTIGFSLPGGAVAVGTLWTFQSSLKEFRSVMEWVNKLLAYAAQSFQEVGRLAAEGSRAIGLEYLIKQSVESSAKVYDNLLMPILRISSNRGIGYSLATLGGVGSLAGSSYLIFNGSADAMKYESARNLFGYNAQLSKQIDEKVEELSYVFSLKPVEVVAVKDALQAAIVESAVANKFRKDAVYNVDLVEVLAKKQILSKEQVAAADLLRQIVAASTAVKVDEGEQARLGRAVTVILATQALLEAMIESEKLAVKSEKEARQMLGNSKRVVKRIHENLVQY